MSYHEVTIPLSLCGRIMAVLWGNSEDELYNELAAFMKKHKPEPDEFSVMKDEK